MNTQKTALVHKLILVMLVLIFGCLVLLLIYGRKQIEALGEGNGQAARVSGDSNAPVNVDRAFPSLRSSKPRPAAIVEPDQPAKVAPVAHAAANVQPQPVADPGPTVVVPGPVLKSSQWLSEEPGISGRVILVGRPPDEIPIGFDPACGAMHTTRVTTRHFVVSRDGGLANAFVYISKGAERVKIQPPSTPVLLEQKDCMYQPYIFGAMVNQSIQIKNSDPILHNVHSLPRADGNREFNFAQPVQGQIDERTFSKPELFIKIKCDVHDWMLSYVTVLSHPFFAVTDSNGVFQLANGLPPGQYELTVAHLKAGTMSKTVRLRKSNNVQVDFQLPVNGKPWRGLPAP
jgi:hypothetical protein